MMLANAKKLGICAVFSFGFTGATAQESGGPCAGRECKEVSRLVVQFEQDVQMFVNSPGMANLDCNQGRNPARSPRLTKNAQPEVFSQILGMFVAAKTSNLPFVYRVNDECEIIYAGFI